MIMLNNNLRIFITAAETGNLTETAKKLYISQPAISQAIKKLEEELNVTLFIRNKRSSLKLTDTGREILLLAHQMADLENRLYQTAYNENHLMGGIVRIATVPLGASLVLAHVLPEFKKQFPEVTVELLEGNPSEVKDMVLNYQVDLGITTSPYQGLEHKPLFQDEMVSIHAGEAQDIRLDSPTEPLVLCQIAYDSINEQLKGTGSELSHALLVQAASTQIDMISGGNGVGIISELMLSTIPNQLSIGKVFPEIRLEISLVTHNFNNLTSAAKEMSRMIVSSVSEG